jgi:hypothetical protein
VVTLRGEVPSEDVQQAAIDGASRVPLVGTVRNQLVISGEPLPAIALARPAAEADVVEPDTLAVRA